MRIKANWRGINSFLTAAATAALVEAEARSVATSASAGTGWAPSDDTTGDEGWVRVVTDTGTMRARCAVLAGHPNAGVRDAAKDVLAGLV